VTRGFKSKKDWFEFQLCHAIAMLALGRQSISLSSFFSNAGDSLHYRAIVAIKEMTFTTHHKGVQ
jgi:hypothetical protein